MPASRLWIAFVLLALTLAGCGGGPPPGPPPIEPFPGYFQSMRPEGTYLFETLANKQFFDADPEGLAGLEFAEFISRTGERVFINVDPTGKVVIEGNPNGPSTRERPRVDQIARGYEIIEETELFGFEDPDAPPLPATRADDAPGPSEDSTSRPAPDPVDVPD